MPRQGGHRRRGDQKIIDFPSMVAICWTLREAQRLLAVAFSQNARHRQVLGGRLL